jgi:hypothetical protein
VTDKGFEKAAEFLEDEPSNLPANTHDPETGEPIGQGLTELDFAMFQNRFGPAMAGEISPQRRALAEARMRTVAALLGQQASTFVEYLKKIGLPYTFDTNADGKKIICITLEDIAENDMKRG